MPDKFDPYREALVMETTTVWPEEFSGLDAREKAHLANELHASPESVQNLTYVRTHTGFCRTITVTEDDLARVRG